MDEQAADERVIFHIDLDAFFVAVERTHDPSLTGRPVIVGGSVGDRGVVSCASYEARTYGVRSAMPIATARRLCPDAVFIPGNHGWYREVSRQFKEILDRYSPLVEQASVDEAYADMTGAEQLLGCPEEGAQRIRDQIARDLKVTASIGIGASKLVAKVASGACKPDGMLRVSAGDAGAFLAPLPIRKLPGLGPKTESALRRLGIHTLGELVQQPLGPLARTIGPTAARHLKDGARGIDPSPVAPNPEAKSISAETTFREDSDDRAYLDARLLELSERVGARLRRAGLQARSVSLKVRYHDFGTVSRQATLVRAADGNDAIFKQAKSLLAEALRQRRTRVRLLGVAAGGLTEPGGQLSLLHDETEVDAAMSRTLDRIRDRFGREIILRGAALANKRRPDGGAMG